MKLTEDQKKDLRPIKANEFVLGGYFYVSDPVTKEFHLAQVTEYDMQWRPTSMRMKTAELSKQGRLHVRINKPWSAFSGKEK